MSMQIVIVTPALADANNGNWQTARRWQQFLAPLYPTRLAKSWPDAEADGDAAMIALHARRSAASIAAWHEQHGGRNLALVLTGTDLYRDIDTDAAAQRSLELARLLIVLQEPGLQALPPAHRARTRVILQSATARCPAQKTSRHLRAVAVGHLRAEKDPATLFAAVRLLAERPDILIDHVGAALEPALGAQARQLMDACPNYRWLGGLPHEEARRRIQRAHVLINPSLMEGGPHVVMEAVCSGTPVIASRIDGNLGMLGADYEGYFAQGNAAGLAALLAACRDGQARPRGLLQRLGRQAQSRRPLFAPEAECGAVRQLAADLLAGGAADAKKARA